jgi:predicted nucleic acid-binding Zn ribbon protein
MHLFRTSYKPALVKGFKMDFNTNKSKGIYKYKKEFKRAKLEQKGSGFYNKL